jgi:hypothetical protein
MTTAPTPPVAPQRKKSGLGRKVLLGVAALLVVLVILVALAPMLFGGTIKGIVVGNVNAKLHGKLEIADLSLSWFGGQSLGGVKVIDAAGRSVVTASKVSTRLSLWQAVRGDYNLGDANIDDLKATVVTGKEGKSNLEEVFSGFKSDAPSKEPTRLPPSLKGNVKLSRAAITYETAGQEPAVIDPLDVTVAFGPGQPVDFTLVATSKQGSISGKLDGHGKLENLIAADGLVTPEKIQANAELSAAGFPPAAIDQFLKLDGKLAAATGDKLDMKLTVVGTAAQQDLKLTLASPRLTVPISARLANNEFSLTEPAAIKLLLTPELFAKLVAGDMKLARDCAAELTITEFRAPLGAFDPAKLAVTASLKSGELNFTGDKQIGDATISNLAAAIETRSLTGDVALSANADVVADKLSGKVAISNGKISGLYDAAGKLQWQKLKANVVAVVQGLPTPLIDRLAKQDGALVELVGPIINLSAAAQSSGDQNTLSVKLAVDTQNIKTENLTLTMADDVHLDQPAAVKFTVTPALAQKYLPKDSTIKLFEGLPVVLALEKFSMPRAKEGEPAFQPAKTILVGTLSTALAHLTGLPKINEATFTNVKLTLTGESLAKPQVALAALLTEADPKGIVHDVTGDGQMNLDATVTITLDDKSAHGPITAAANLKGNQLSASLAAKLPADAKSIDLTGSKLDLTVTPALLKRYNLVQEGQPTITGPTLVSLDVKKLQTPIGGEFDAANLRVAIAGAISPSPDPNDPIAAIFGGKLGLSVQSDDGKTLALKIDSGNLIADVTAVVTQGDKARLTLTKPGTITATLTPAQLAALGYGKNGQTTISGPAAVKLSIDKLDAPLANFSLAGVTVVAKVTVDKLALAGGKQIEGTTLSDTTGTLALDGAAGMAMFKLTGTAAVPGQAAPGPLAVDVAVAKLFDDKHAINAKAMTIDAKSLKFKGLPTAFVEALSGAEPGHYVALLGASVDVDATVNLTAVSPAVGVVDVKLSAPNLTADAGLKLGEFIEATRPISVKYTLTPAGYAELTKPAPVTTPPGETPAKPAQARTLAQAVVFEAMINSLKYPMPVAAPAAVTAPAPAKIDPSKASLTASIKSSRIGLKRGADRSVVIDNFNFSLDGPSLAQPIAIKGNADITGNPGAAPAAGQKGPGKMTIDGTLGDLFAPDGTLTAENLSANLIVNLIGIPGQSVEVLFGSGDPLLEELVGAGGDLKITTKLQKMTGPVTVDAKAANVESHLDAQLADGVATLNKDAAARVRVTERMGQLTKHPVLKQAVFSEKPIVLTLFKDGFKLPFKNFDIAKVAIPRGTLVLDKLVLNNAGLIRSITELPQLVGVAAKGNLKEVGNRLSQDKINAWFAPVEFHMAGGVAAWERMDVLLGADYQVATWGTIDLNKRTGDMVLGITQRALKEIYGIVEHADDPNFAEQFPMVGPIDAIMPDKTNMTARLTLLTGVGSASKAVGGKLGDSAGKLLEGLGALDKAINSDKASNAKPAPPAKHPLPWEDPAQNPDLKNKPGDAAIPGTTPVPGTTPTPGVTNLTPTQAPVPAPADQPKAKPDAGSALDPLLDLLDKQKKADQAEKDRKAKAKADAAKAKADAEAKAKADAAATDPVDSDAKPKPDPKKKKK